MKRETKETKVEVSINLDGTGVCSSQSQIPFLDHMMDVRMPPLPHASHHAPVPPNAQAPSESYYEHLASHLPACLAWK